MKHLPYVVMSLVLITTAISPVSALVMYDWNPNGFPSEIQTYNVGTVPYLRSYSSNANAFAAICTNASTPVGSHYINAKKTNGWVVFDNGVAVVNNGTLVSIGQNPAIDTTWDTAGTQTHYLEQVVCKNAGDTLRNYYNIRYVIRSDRLVYRNTSSTDFPVNFTGTPTSGPTPLTISFAVTNFTSVNTSGISWSFGDGNITTSSINPINHLYQNPGTYTVRMDYYNVSGVANYIQKNNYITVGAPNATKTKFFQTIDGTNGNIVLNSSIQLNDIENSSWVNATELTSDGMSSITTLEGHHINAYAQALGYSDADDLDILNDGLPAYIMMWPTFAKNVSEGNVSLYVTVKDKDTKANIKGAGVTMSPSSGPAQSTTTNEAGIAYFIVKNSTMVLITAQAIGQGYQTATTTINTGINSGGSASAAATILLGKNTVTPTFPTVTTLPGGGTPTATITILPGCEDQISEEGQAKCRRAQSNQGLSFLSANMGDLIMLCVFVTMLYLLGIKLGR